jgi:ABC-type glycerol-3-phosphate transport system substrate-binding protein
MKTGIARFLGIPLLTFWALGIVSCGSASNGTLTFYHYAMTSALNTELEEKLTAFTAESGISVKHVPISKDNYDAAISTKLTSSKTGIDVLYLDQPLLAQYAKAGSIANLDDYVSDDVSYEDPTITVDGAEVFNKNAFYESAWKTAQYQGSTYAIPLTLNTSVLFYNLATIKAACSYDTDEEATSALSSIATWQDLKDFVNGAGDYSGHGVNGLGSSYAMFGGMGDGGYMGWYSQCFIAAAGGEMMDETTKVVLPDDDGSVTTAFEMIKYLYDRSPDSLINSSSGFTGTSASPAGKILFKLADSSAIDDLDVAYTTFGAIPFPGFSAAIGSMSNIGGENLAIASKSTLKGEAVELIHFLLSEDSMPFLQQCTNNYAAVKEYATIDTFATDAASPVYAMYSVIKSQLVTAQVRPVVSGWLQVNDNAIPQYLGYYIDGDEGYETPTPAIAAIREYAADYLAY